MSKHSRVNKDAGDVEAGIVAFNGAIAEDLSYDEERRDLISRLESKGYFYNWDKFDNRQLYRMATEKPARTKRKVATPIKNIEIKYCEECGTRLTDGGYCPICDDGEEHLEENMEDNYIISYENLPVTRQTKKRVVGGYPGWEEWDEVEDTVDYDLELSVEEVDEGLFGIDQLWEEPRINDDNSVDYVFQHRDELFNKYQEQLKDYYRDLAIERAKAAVNDGTLGSKLSYMEDLYMGNEDNIEESFFDDDDVDSEDTYEEIASKSVEDSDGFMTDYTWYRMGDGNNVFIFGDKEIYTPNTAEWDWEEESDEAAQDWFDSYIGFGDPDDYFNESVEEAVDRDVMLTGDNTWRLQGRRLKADAADLIMDYYVDDGGQNDLYVINEHDGKYSVRNPRTRTRVTVQFDLDCSDDMHKFTIDGVEYSTRSDREAGKIIQDAVERKHRRSFDVYVDESKSTNENAEIKLSKDSKMIEIPIEDNSEVGELGHPIQQGIGDPRRKREQDSKNTPVKESAEKSAGGSTITLKSDYFYDLVANIEDAGWDEIVDFAYEHGWVKDGQIIIPAGTVLEFVSQDRYYNTYEVEVGENREVFPFNRDLLIEYPLEEALTEDFKEGDSVYVKPSRKSGRVISVKGDIVTVEIDGGKDPDRRDTFYTSDLVKEDPLTENMKTYNVTFYMDSLDDNVMSGPSTTKMIRASSEEEAKKKLIDNSTDKYYIPTVTKVEKITESFNTPEPEDIYSFEHLLYAARKNLQDNEYEEFANIINDNNYQSFRDWKDNKKYGWDDISYFICYRPGYLNQIFESVETSKEWEHKDKEGKVGRIRQSDGKGNRKPLTRDQAKEIAKFRGHEDDELYSVNESKNLKEYYRGEDALDDVLSWLQDHEQAWDDFTSHFSDVEDEDLTYDMVIDWISDHDTLYDDYLAFFELDESKSVKESFADTLTSEQMEKIDDIIDSHTPLMPGREWEYVDELMNALNIDSKSDIMRVLVDYLGFEENEAEKIVDDTLEFRNGGPLDEAIEMTADEMKAKHGTDNPDIINAGKEEKDRVALKESPNSLPTSVSEVQAALGEPHYEYIGGGSAEASFGRITLKLFQDTDQFYGSGEWCWHYVIEVDGKEILRDASSVEYDNATYYAAQVLLQFIEIELIFKSNPEAKVVFSDASSPYKRTYSVVTPSGEVLKTVGWYTNKGMFIRNFYDDRIVEETLLRNAGKPEEERVALKESVNRESSIQELKKIVDSGYSYMCGYEIYSLINQVASSFEEEVGRAWEKAGVHGSDNAFCFQLFKKTKELLKTSGILADPYVIDEFNRALRDEGVRGLTESLAEDRVTLEEDSQDKIIANNIEEFCNLLGIEYKRQWGAGLFYPTSWNVYREFEDMLRSAGLGNLPFYYYHPKRDKGDPDAIICVEDDGDENIEYVQVTANSEPIYASGYTPTRHIESVDESKSINEAMIYTDTNGFLGEPGGKYTMSQFRRMWQDKDNDPVMSGYDSFEEWVGETISQMDAHE